MKSRRIALVALLSLRCLAAALPEDFRTIIAGVASLSADSPDGVRLTMGYNDAVAVSIPKDSPFIQGFEIELKAPPSAQSSLGFLAYEIWRRVDPSPDKNRYAYSGERLITQPLQSRAGLVIQVPVRKDHGLKSGPYSTVLPLLVEPRDLPVVFKLYAPSKVVTSDLESAQFTLRIRPLLTDEGALRLQLRYPEGTERGPVVVTVDEKRLAEGRYIDGKEALVLKAGNHFLHVASELYRDETRSFTIEQGKTLDLSIDLAGTMPVLAIEAPDSAQVSLDGAKINHVAKPSFTVEPGDHTVVCRIGDYTVTRKFTAFRGKTYRVVLAIDLQVQESQ